MYFTFIIHNFLIYKTYHNNKFYFLLKKFKDTYFNVSQMIEAIFTPFKPSFRSTTSKHLILPYKICLLVSFP